MKGILFTAFVLMSILVSAQGVPNDSATLRTKVNTEVVPNGAKQITATSLNQIFNSIITLMSQYSLDSCYRINDTLFFTGRKKNTIKVVLNSGGAPSETDPTVSLVAKSINGTDTARWNGKQDALQGGTGAVINYPFINVQTTTALWNANKLQGRDISSSLPSTNNVLKWNGSAWAPANESGGVPNGGSTNQLLGKNSGTDGDVSYKTVDKTFIGLSNVDNTSDASKPVSSAQAAALILKIDSIRRRTDSIFMYKNGAEIFAYKDSVGSGGGAGNTNTGTSFRWLNPGTQALRTFAAGFGIILDTSAVSGAINAVIDTAKLATVFRVSLVENDIEKLKADQWYLDQRAGNDLNDGKSAERAVRTVAKLLTLPIAKHDAVNVARGSYFRDFLNLSTVDSITIRDYGSGNKPVFDAADSAYNYLFTKTGGYTNLYQISWTNAFRDNTDISQYSAWEDGHRLVRAVSQTQCDTIPGSYYAASVSQPAGTNTIYLHSRNNSSIITNGRLYEITRRPQGIQVRDGCKVFNMHTKRNGSNNGSIETRHNTYLQGIVAEDGVKHNLFMASGTAEDCIAWKCDSAFGGGTTMFVSFTTSASADTMDVLYKNCMAIAGKNNDPFISATIVGIYMHTGGPSAYRSCTVNGGYFLNCAYGVDGEPNFMTVENAHFYRNFTAISKVGSGSINVLNNIFLDNKFSVNANPTTLNFHQNKIRMLPYDGSERVIKGFIDSASVTYNTLYNGDFTNAYFTQNDGGTIKYNFKHNLFTGPSTTASIPLLSTSQASTDNKVYADSNYYYYGVYVFSDGSKTVAQMQALSPAQEVNSGILIPESIFYGGVNNGDFFVSKTDTVYGKGGSNSTFDSTFRFPYYIFDFNSEQNILGGGIELNRALRTKAELDKPNNLQPVNATNTQNLNVYKDIFALGVATSGPAPSALYIDEVSKKVKSGTLPAHLVGATATDADYTITSTVSFIQLSTISANRAATLPTPTAGKIIIVWNSNSAAFTWNITGTVINPDASSVTSFTNDTVTHLLGTGSQWLKIN